MDDLNKFDYPCLDIYSEEDKYKNKLLIKLIKEYNSFIDELYSLEPSDIVAKCYEKVCKEELVYFFEYSGDFSVKQYKCLIDEPDLIDQCYDEWLKNDGDFSDCLEYSANKAVDLIFEDKIREENKDEKSIR